MKPADTVAVGPSFYENDLDKWYSKFKKSIQEREYQKK